MPPTMHTPRASKTSLLFPERKPRGEGHGAGAWSWSRTAALAARREGRGEALRWRRGVATHPCRLRTGRFGALSAGDRSPPAPRAWCPARGRGPRAEPHWPRTPRLGPASPELTRQAASVLGRRKAQRQEGARSPRCPHNGAASTPRSPCPEGQRRASPESGQKGSARSMQGRARGSRTGAESPGKPPPARTGYSEPLTGRQVLLAATSPSGMGARGSEQQAGASPGPGETGICLPGGRWSCIKVPASTPGTPGAAHGAPGLSPATEVRGPRSPKAAEGRGAARGSAQPMHQRLRQGPSSPGSQTPRFQHPCQAQAG